MLALLLYLLEVSTEACIRVDDVDDTVHVVVHLDSWACSPDGLGEIPYLRHSILVSAALFQWVLPSQIYVLGDFVCSSNRKGTQIVKI